MVILIEGWSLLVQVTERVRDKEVEVVGKMVVLLSSKSMIWDIICEEGKQRHSGQWRP